MNDADRARVLFVDDEPLILAGIRASLRGERDRWDLSFVTSGEAAMEVVRSEGLDVLVTDMRMPGMDGAALLRMVHDTRPDVVRIVLSGEASAEQTLRSLPHVHRWLPKPCDRDELVATIESALGHDRSHLVDELVGGVLGLPTPPSLYTRILAELEDPDASFARIAGLVEGDPAITAKVLQWGSSPLVGWGRIDRIDDVLRAVGLAAVTEMVLSAEVLGLIASAGSRGGRDHESLRRLAELTGHLAAAMTPKGLQSTARTTGLLHTIGFLVATTRATDRLEGAIRAARTRHLLLADVEEEILGVTLPEVGARLLNLWGLPLDMVQGVRDHRHAAVTAGTDLGVPAAVRVAAWAAGSALAAAGVLDPVLVEPAVDLPPTSDAPWRRRAAAVLHDELDGTETSPLDEEPRP